VQCASSEGHRPCAVAAVTVDMHPQCRRRLLLGASARRRDIPSSGRRRPRTGSTCSPSGASVPLCWPPFRIAVVVSSPGSWMVRPNRRILACPVRLGGRCARAGPAKELFRCLAQGPLHSRARRFRAPASQASSSHLFAPHSQPHHETCRSNRWLLSRPAGASSQYATSMSKLKQS
jgi:hypothetical protein